MSFNQVYAHLTRKAAIPAKEQPSITSQLDYERKLNAALKAQLSPKAAVMTTPPPFLTREEKERPKMPGVQIKEIESEAFSPEVTMPGADQIAMLQSFRQEMQIASGQVVERSMAYADQLSKTIMDGVRQQMAGLNRPKVMVVEIDKQQHKLTKPATPHLARLLVNAKLGLNTLLIGPAGSGKTIAASQVAEALGLPFGHVCLTAGASETWLFGRQTPNGFVEAAFSRFYREGGVFLGDELDAADPNLLLAINTALANGELYNPISGDQIKRHDNFVFIGAANTVGKGADGVYTGRARLDGATLTRFVKIAVDYCEEIEKQVCPDRELRELLQEARTKLRSMKSQEILSTRCLAAAYAQKCAGVEMNEILASLTMGWPDDLAKQVGLVVVEAAKPSQGGKKRVTQEVF